ncbi:hypothetical protein QZH41_002405 [Actinostola sp. cb2023]|nr:hypothetical protein QZH41_002405 [Actinostola sp. cb2023]
MVTTMTASILTVTAIAVDRYLAIRLKIQYRPATAIYGIIHGATYISTFTQRDCMQTNAVVLSQSIEGQRYIGYLRSLKRNGWAAHDVLRTLKQENPDIYKAFLSFKDAVIENDDEKFEKPKDCKSQGFGVRRRRSTGGILENPGNLATYISTFTQYGCMLTNSVVLSQPIEDQRYIVYVSIKDVVIENDDEKFEKPKDCKPQGLGVRRRRSTGGILENPGNLGI